MSVCPPTPPAHPVHCSVWGHFPPQAKSTNVTMPEVLLGGGRAWQRPRQAGRHVCPWVNFHTGGLEAEWRVFGAGERDCCLRLMQRHVQGLLCFLPCLPGVQAGVPVPVTKRKMGRAGVPPALPVCLFSVRFIPKNGARVAQHVVCAVCSSTQNRHTHKMPSLFVSCPCLQGPEMERETEGRRFLSRQCQLACLSSPSSPVWRKAKSRGNTVEEAGRFLCVCVHTPRIHTHTHTYKGTYTRQGMYTRKRARANTTPRTTTTTTTTKISKHLMSTETKHVSGRIGREGIRGEGGGGAVCKNTSLSPLEERRVGADLIDYHQMLSSSLLTHTHTHTLSRASFH